MFDRMHSLGALTHTRARRIEPAGAAPNKLRLIDGIEPRLAQAALDRQLSGSQQRERSLVVASKFALAVTFAFAD